MNVLLFNKLWMH